MPKKQDRVGVVNIHTLYQRVIPLPTVEEIKIAPGKHEVFKMLDEYAKKDLPEIEKQSYLIDLQVSLDQVAFETSVEIRKTLVATLKSFDEEPETDISDEYIDEFISQVASGEFEEGCRIQYDLMVSVGNLIRILHTTIGSSVEYKNQISPEEFAQKMEVILFIKNNMIIPFQQLRQITSNVQFASGVINDLLKSPSVVFGLQTAM